MINAGTVAAYLTLDTSSFDSGISSALMSISGFNAGAQLIKNAADSIKSVMSGVGNFIKDSFLSSMSAAQLSVGNGVGAIITSITRLPFSAASVVNGFISSWNGISASVLSSKVSIGAACNGIVGSAVSALGRLPASAKSIMIQTGQGMVSGLSSMKNSILAAAQSIANAVASKMRSALGIHSPSRVMMEIGRFTVEGMAVGMNDNIDMIKREAENAAKSAADGLSNISYASYMPKSISNKIDSTDRYGFDAEVNNSGYRSNYSELGAIADKLDKCIRLLSQNDTLLEIDGRSFGRLVREYV